jgi:4-amino-4-deoxy-L-arabinose transferase-like glycosyltransferase
VQALCDAGAAVLLYLILAELLPAGAPLAAGLFAALSPQLSYYSLVLLPDLPAAHVLLVALYLIVRAAKSRDS